MPGRLCRPLRVAEGCGASVSLPRARTARRGSGC